LSRKKFNFDISENNLLDLEKNLTWVFTSMGTTEIANWLFSDYAHIVNEPWLGQHLGIITDRREEGVVTNFEMHRDRIDYLFCEKFKKTWIFYLRKLILGRLFSQFGNTQRPIIISDLPAANFASNILAQATPNSKVLIIVRDGKDVVNYKAASLLPFGKELQIGLTTFSQKNKIEFLKLESKKWTKMVSILLDVKKNHDKKLVKIIRFEDLLKNTSKEIEGIFEFINIKPDQSKLSKITSNVQKKIEGSSQKRKFLFRNKNLTQEEKDAMEEIMKDTLKELDYE